MSKITERKKSSGKKSNKRKIKIQPPPVKELFLRGSIVSFCRPDNLAPTLTPDVPGQVSANRNVETLAGDHNMLCCKHTSASKESKKRNDFYVHFPPIVNILVGLLLFVPQKIYAYVQRELEQLNDIHQNDMEVLPYKEPTFTANLKGEEDAPFIKNPHIRFFTSGPRDLPHSPLSTSILEKEQLTTQPTVGQ